MSRNVQFNLSATCWVRRPSNTLRRFARDDKGAALIEFAIVLPVLMAIFFAILGWGISLTITDSMYGAAREAARDLAVGTVTPTQAEASVAADLAAWGAGFLIVAENAAMTGTDDVRVAVSIANPLANSITFIPLMPTLSAEVVMRKE